MKILVTGGTGLIGNGVVPQLLARGHQVRILSRKADGTALEWPDGVETWDGDVSDRSSLEGATGGCEVVLHVAGIAKEDPPAKTFDLVNVAGTRNVILEAEKSGVRRVVFVSSLGADDGTSAYHKSKREAEAIVKSFPRQWLIVRPGNVYGPGDEVVSLLLRMVRTLPAVPVIDDGNQTFQPIWYEDLGRVLAEAAERNELNHATFEVAGEELTSMIDILERLGDITGLYPKRVHLKSGIAKAATSAASILGLDVPVDDNILTMLQEQNYIEKPKDNATTGIFNVRPVPIGEGLKKLVDALPEQPPSEGVGPLHRKHYWGDIVRSSKSPDAIFREFRENFADWVPIEIGTEAGSSKEIVEGASMTGRIPVRGNFQMRVEKIEKRTITILTVEGHPLAAVLRFAFESRGDTVRFHIEIFSRAATMLDLVFLQSGGGTAQDLNWQTLVETVLRNSGGEFPALVHSESATVSGPEAEDVERWTDSMVKKKRRDDREESAERPG